MTKKKAESLTLHQLLTALSFWGTAVRLFLFTIIASLGFVSALSELTAGGRAEEQIMILIYVLGSYLVFDFGYVLTARAYPLSKLLDKLVITVVGLGMASLYVIPKIVVSSAIKPIVDPLIYVFFLALAVLATRIMLGLLFSTRK